MLGCLANNLQMHLLFDLDGTLTDSRTGIVRCYQHALSELGREIPRDSEFTPYVGPPLATCFAGLLKTDDSTTIERAIEIYRKRFERLGIFENVLYPGIGEALGALSGAAHTLYVVTAKPVAYASRILESFAIGKFFRAVYGPDLADRRFSKGSLVRTALKVNEITCQSAFVVGDRADDIDGAQENGIRSIGVTWGYGSREELAGANALVDSAAELVEYIRRGA